MRVERSWSGVKIPEDDLKRLLDGGIQEADDEDGHWVTIDGRPVFIAGPRPDDPSEPWTPETPGSPEYTAEVAQRERIVKEIAKSLNFPEERIEYRHEYGPGATVAGQSFKAAGAYDPHTGKIVMYTGAFNFYEDTQGELLRGMVAHEVSHAMFQAFLAVGRMDYEDAEKAGVLRGGGLVPASIRERYPLAYFYQRIMRFADEGGDYAKQDGITAYSTQWWTEIGGKSETLVRRAVDETLAEWHKLATTARSPDAMDDFKRTHPAYAELYSEMVNWWDLMMKHYSDWPL